MYLEVKDRPFALPAETIRINWGHATCNLYLTGFVFAPTLLVFTIIGRSSENCTKRIDKTLVFYCLDWQLEIFTRHDWQNKI